MLAAALRDVHPKPATLPEVPFQTVCLVTPETVDVNTVKSLRRAYDVVVGVEVIEEDLTKELELLGAFSSLSNTLPPPAIRRSPSAWTSWLLSR